MAKSVRNKIVLVAAIVAAVCVVAAFVAYKAAFVSYDGKTAARVYIGADATTDSVAAELKRALGEGYGGRVATLWDLLGGETSRSHGSYVVEPGQSAISVAKRIKEGRQTPVKVTFNNIRTLQQLAERVAGRMEFDKADFLAACDTVLAAKNFTKEGYIAAFVPDTYEFYWTSPAAVVVERLSDVRDDFWTDERRAEARAMGLSPVEVATVASIVEEETAKSDERPKVARLYLNRLKRGMALQADPTVKFALGDFSLRRIRGNHLKVDSPYNTYKNTGLPPGPIRMPERATLEAVLNAPAHDYLYMCAREDFSGYHNFASDYATHQANARRYQAELNRRNIR